VTFCAENQLPASSGTRSLSSAGVPRRPEVAPLLMLDHAVNPTHTYVKIHTLKRILLILHLAKFGCSILSELQERSVFVPKARGQYFPENHQLFIKLNVEYKKKKKKDMAADPLHLSSILLYKFQV